MLLFDKLQLNNTFCVQTSWKLLNFIYVPQTDTYSVQTFNLTSSWAEEMLINKFKEHV